MKMSLVHRLDWYSFAALKVEQTIISYDQLSLTLHKEQKKQPLWSVAFLVFTRLGFRRLPLLSKSLSFSCRKLIFNALMVPKVCVQQTVSTS